MLDILTINNAQHHGIQVWLKRHWRFSLLRAVFEGTQLSWAGSMFDPRTGGVAQQPKTQWEEWR